MLDLPLIDVPEAVENTTTEENACVERMAELLKKAAEDKGQESLSWGISDTLDMILNGYTATPDSLDGGSGEWLDD
jgi:hypothetical protein